MSRGLDAMKKVIACFIALSMLSGCGTLTGVSVGKKVTTYDLDGNVTSETADHAVGDPNTEFYSAVKEVAGHTSANIDSRAKAIQNATAPATGDNGEVRAWKAAFGALAISQIQDTTAQNIGSIKPATTGYDVAKDAVGALAGVARVGVMGYAATKIIDKVTENAGDKVTIAGDGNHTESTKTTVVNDIASTTTGNESPSTVSTDPTATQSVGGTEAGAISPSALSAWRSCSSAGGTQGQVAGCMASQGVDVKIEGGITYVEGVKYGPANSFPYVPVVEE
jgi:hypothetical protein